MLPALRRLSVLPLWFSFGPSSSSLKNLPDLTSVAKISSQALLAAAGLHNLSFSERNLYQSDQAYQTYQTRNNSPPANQHLQQTPRGSRPRFQTQIPPPSDL
ncbi:hypothetical protein ILYODFUR_009321 [Ilyodon furcidens]|uniref:Uncharacterized protein n=1 Tax=Ilyodon furcidens TaxID=33524 RepID=A0ABV0V593_9TELE